MLRIVRENENLQETSVTLLQQVLDTAVSIRRML